MVPVSAVVAARNEERYIAGCLESILGQTAPVDELLVVDDGSTDGTVEVAEAYPVDIYTVEYGAVYPSKRLSICAAKNDVVLAVDGDTVLAPDFLERGLRHLEEGYDAATGRILPHDRRPMADVAAFIANSLPQGVYFSGPGYVLDRRSYLEACRVTRIDGFVDICMQRAEIPLEKLNLVKDLEMKMWTRLPSRGQRRMLNGARATGLLLTAIRLLAA